MNYQILRDRLESISPIENEAWLDLEQFLVTKKLNINEVLWHKGSTCKHLVFIVKGLVRSYSMMNGKERTHQFYLEKSVFYDDYSFISQQGCKNTYEALEPCEIIVIPRGALYLMYDKYKSFERLGRLAVEFAHVQHIDKMTKIFQSSAEENYKELIDNHPEILRRVPLKIIASYFDITPEHLSRIRKQQQGFDLDQVS